MNDTTHGPGVALAVLKAMPELCGHLAALTLPSGAPRDGQPVAAEVRRLPLRGAPLDDLDAVFRELHNSVSYWMERLGVTWLVSMNYMTRVDAEGEVVGPRMVVTEANGIESITVWAQTLVDRLATWWPEISEHEAFDSWVLNVDDWFGRVAARWPLEGRQPVRQHPRECGNCGAQDVLADPLVPGQALCRSCWKVYQPEQWVPVREAPTRAGRSRSTVEAWISAGELVVRSLQADHDSSLPLAMQAAGPVRHVEVGALRRLAEVKAAQRNSTLRRGSRSGQA